MEGYLVFLNDNISSVHNISSLWSYIEKSRTFADLVLLPLKNLRKMVQILVANVGCIAMLPSFQTSPISDIWYNNSLVSYDVSYMYTSQFSMYDDRGEESLRAIELHLGFKMQKMYSPYSTLISPATQQFWIKHKATYLKSSIMFVMLRWPELCCRSLGRLHTTCSKLGMIKCRKYEIS